MKYKTVKQRRVAVYSNVLPFRWSDEMDESESKIPGHCNPFKQQVPTPEFDLMSPDIADVRGVMD